MSTKNPTADTTEVIDFAEASWQVVDSAKVTRAFDYGSLEATKTLLDGKIIEVPSGTRTDRLYRWLNKRGYVLHKRVLHESIYLWVDKKLHVEPTTNETTV